MKVQLNSPQTVTRPVTVGEESFEISVKPPTLAERLADNELLSLRSQQDGAWLLHRLKSTIAGWSGLVDHEENPIPFSWENLAALCEQFEEVYSQLIALAHEAYRPLPKEERKN